jgi:hypothetical protein
VIFFSFFVYLNQIIKQINFIHNFQIRKLKFLDRLFQKKMVSFCLKQISFKTSKNRVNLNQYERAKLKKRESLRK